PVENRLGRAATVVLASRVIGGDASLRATDDRGKFFTAAIAVQHQINLFVDPQQADDIAELAAAVHILAINLDDDVRDLDARCFGCAALQHVGDQGSPVRTGLQCLFHGRRQVLDLYPQLATANLAVTLQMSDHCRDHVYRNRKGNPRVRAAAADDGGVHAHQVAFQIHQCTAGVADVDGRIGLDEVFIVLVVQACPAQRTDYARSYGLPHAERVADGDHIVPYPQVADIGEPQLHKALRFNLQQGNVGAGI